jgi:hypothetical protein
MWRENGSDLALVRLRMRSVVHSFSPEYIQSLRAILDEVMSKVPADQDTPAVKARMAETILRAAGNGQTTYEGLLGVAYSRLNTILAVENHLRRAMR